jgi:hypothetical protein
MPPCRLDPHRRLSSCVQYQWTPLHWAAGKGHGDTCALLLERKGDVNARDKVMRVRARGEEGEGLLFLFLLFLFLFLLLLLLLFLLLLLLLFLFLNP